MTLWAGRFSGKLDPGAWALNASISFDRRMAQQDIAGSLAWAGALHQAGVLSADELAAMQGGLQTVGAEFSNGSFVFQEGDEDIHTAVERRLGELIGPLGGKLHTGRSRNDQVATDFRLWTLEAIDALAQLIGGLQQVLLERAESELHIVMPGYTHLQRAQPILLSHWWLSHFWPLQRDCQRLEQLRARCAVLPLGAGALAGAAFPIDRAALAQALDFLAPSPNSLDAVSDRDFAAEFLFCAALTGVHLSRLAEAVIIFSSAEFGYFELSDAFSTGSSLMPQKKNPDVFELARGKAGTLIGLLSGLLATLKGLPSTYDKDLQEDKPAVFAAFDTLAALLPVLSAALRTLKVNDGRMSAAIDANMMATDLADYLVQKGVPFREAHAAAGRLVQQAIAAGISLDALPLSTYQQASPLIAEDIHQVFNPHHSISRRSVIGGTAPEAVTAQLAQAKLEIRQPTAKSRF